MIWKRLAFLGPVLAAGLQLALAQAPPFLRKEWQEAHYPSENGWMVQALSEAVDNDLAKVIRKKDMGYNDPKVIAALSALVSKAREQLSNQLLVSISSVTQDRVNEQSLNGSRRMVSTFSSSTVSRSDIVLTGVKEERRVDKEGGMLHVLVAVNKLELADATTSGLTNELESIKRNARLGLSDRMVAAKTLEEIETRLQKVDRQIVLLGYLDPGNGTSSIRAAYDECLALLIQLRTAQAGSERQEFRRLATKAFQEQRWEACLGECDNLLAEEPEDANTLELRDRALAVLGTEVERLRADALARNETDKALEQVQRYLNYAPTDPHFLTLRDETAGIHFQRLVDDFDRAAESGTLTTVREAFKRLEDCPSPEAKAFALRRERLEEMEVNAVLGEVTDLERSKSYEEAYRALSRAVKKFPMQERMIRSRQDALRGELVRMYKREVKREKPPRYSIQPAFGVQSPFLVADDVTPYFDNPTYSTAVFAGIYRRMGQRLRDEDKPKGGYKATLLGLRFGYLNGNYAVVEALELNAPEPPAYAPRVSACISTLLVETFLIDVGISNPGQRPVGWSAAESRLQGAVALRMRFAAIHLDLAGLTEWSEALDGFNWGFRITMGAAINFSKAFNRKDMRQVESRINGL